MVQAPFSVVDRDAAPAANSPGRPPLGEILVQNGHVSADQLAVSLRRQTRMQAHLGDLLRTDAGLSESHLLSALATQWKADPLELQRAPPNPELMPQVGTGLCLSARCMPWRRIGGATVIAAVYPDRFERVKPQFEAAFGPVMLALVTEADFTKAMADIFPDLVVERSEGRLDPAESCRTVGATVFPAAIGFTCASLAALTLMAPVAVFALVNIVAIVALVSLTGLKVAAMLASCRRGVEDVQSVEALHPPAHMRQPVVSLIVPLYRESHIAERLLIRLGRIKYPKALLDICLVVEADDRVTQTCLAATELPQNMRVIVVPDGSVKTKPRAMNFALDHCRGSIIGIYDAEDAPDPDQIANVVSIFARMPRDVACLQGRLSFYNARANWLARCFTLDYGMWFAVILPGIAKLGLPVPLGGTTLFFRRETLEALGAWDAFNVTEDADLGVRLARRGYRTELITSTTLEEAACNPIRWVRQRSRWLKGYAMTYASHMRQPRALLADLGLRGFIGVQIVFLASLVQTLLAPVLWSWWLIAFGMANPFAGLAGTYVMVAIVGLFLFAEAVNWVLATIALRRTGNAWLFPWIITLNLYFMLTTIAAIKALIEVLTKPFFWDKTDHGVSPADEVTKPAYAPAGGRVTATFI